MGTPPINPWDLANSSNLVIMVPITFDSDGARYAACAALDVCSALSFAFNALIAVIITSDPRLHSPMFIFMAVVALTDILLSASTLPPISAILMGFNRISFGEAIAQMFFVHLAARFQSFTLSAMSLDRYVAVAFPLRYHTLISHTTALWAVASLFAVAVVFGLVNVYILLSLTQCGPMVNRAIVCQTLSVQTMLCGDKTNGVRYAYVMLVVTVVLPAVFIAFMYVLILVEACNAGISGGGGGRNRQKALRTCASHLLVVSISFTTILFSFTNSLSGVESIPDGWRVFFQISQYTLPPALNPIIYGISTARIRKRISKMFQGNRVSSQEALEP